MIVDEVKIKAIAGKGGKGLAVFSKIRKTLGPTGGSGGSGGSVFIEGIGDLSALRQFRFRKEHRADDGENGRPALKDGQDAKDLILRVPVGTVCHINRKKSIEITKIGQKELIAKGGRGGRGNFLFRSATNTSPREFEEGRPGEAVDVEFELKLIADVGLIGLPNVGKSSLLNELTNAKSKVANYRFTTLEPNLGAYYDLILADIPGLIDGASTGKGLGDKFLRHIERTKVLFHLVSADSPDPLNDYRTIRQELNAYKTSLLEKTEYIFISKKDAINKDVEDEIKSSFKKLKKDVVFISIIEPETLEMVKKLLNKIAEEKRM